MTTCSQLTAPSESSSTPWPTSRKNLSPTTRPSCPQGSSRNWLALLGLQEQQCPKDKKEKSNCQSISSMAKWEWEGGRTVRGFVLPSDQRLVTGLTALSDPELQLGRILVSIELVVELNSLPVGIPVRRRVAARRSQRRRWHQMRSRVLSSVAEQVDKTPTSIRDAAT